VKLEKLQKIEELEKVINSKNRPQILFLYVKDFNISEDIHNLWKAALEKEGPNLEVINLNGLETDAAVFHAELCTIPMFETNRLLYVRHANALLKKIDANKNVLAYFIRDFSNLAASTYLLMQFDEKKIPSSLKFAEEKSLIFEEETVREWDYPRVLKKRVSDLGYTIEDKALELLIEKSAWNYKQAVSALDKLFTYTLHEKNISVNDVQEICYDMQGDLFFSITDALAERKINQCVNLLRHHKLDYGATLTSGIIKLFTNAYRYYYMKQKIGLNSLEILKRLEIKTNHAYQVKKTESRFEKLTSKYTILELREILEKLFDLDKRIKENTKIADQKDIIIMFVLSLEKKESYT